MMRAVGFSRGSIMKMVFYEHLYLLEQPNIRFICALISVIPTIKTVSGGLPVGWY
jgi:hypothetical protein